VRLLVRGRDLHGAVVTGAGPGLAAGPVTVNAAGTYLFVDVAIDPGAAPGPRSITIRTPGGEAGVPLELLAPLPREGRFRGFSPDDAMYLVMPDRFANGDASNDDPEVSRGLLDRTKSRYYHGGDLRGVIDRLPYLADLGITAIWLNPWYDNVNHLNERETYDGEAITDYHGYGAVDFYAVEERLGDLATLREMVDRAHALGIKVIQDQVANHPAPTTRGSPTRRPPRGTTARRSGTSPTPGRPGRSTTPTRRPRCRRRRSRAGSSTSCPT
jgi:neopullulanase